ATPPWASASNQYACAGIPRTPAKWRPLRHPPSDAPSPRSPPTQIIPPQESIASRMGKKNQPERPETPQPALRWPPPPQTPTNEYETQGNPTPACGFHCRVRPLGRGQNARARVGWSAYKPTQQSTTRQRKTRSSSHLAIDPV